MSNPAETCNISVQMDSWHYGRCGAAIKGNLLKNGMPACGRHLGLEKRRLAKEARYTARHAASDAREREAQAMAAEIRAFGVNASPYYDYHGKRGYTGEIIVGPDILKLLRRTGAQQ